MLNRGSVIIISTTTSTVVISSTTIGSKLMMTLISLMSTTKYFINIWSTQFGTVSLWTVRQLTLVHPTCHLGREELRLLHSFPMPLQNLLEPVLYILSFSPMRTDLSFHQMQVALRLVLARRVMSVLLLIIIIRVKKSMN